MSEVHDAEASMVQSDKIPWPADRRRSLRAGAHHLGAQQHDSVAHPQRGVPVVLVAICTGNRRLPQLLLALGPSGAGERSASPVAHAAWRHQSLRQQWADLSWKCELIRGQAAVV